MKIIVGYSHVDAEAALRLLRWMKFLGWVRVPVVLVATKLATRRPAHQAIIAEFANCESHVLTDEDERGWPWSATHLFARSISLVDDDVFWLEPDCVPLREGWFDALHSAYKASRKCFLGFVVPEHRGRNGLVREHMTGCGFYGRAWRGLVPALGSGESKPQGAWDVDFAPQMLPHALHTDLIHHVWYRDLGGAFDAANIKPDAVLFHQCKTGHVMRQLRPEFLTKLGDVVTPCNNMPKFYLSQNTTRPLEVGGVKFTFEKCEFFAPTSSWWGVYGTEDPAEQEKLDALVAKNAIESIDEADFAKWLSKRKNPSVARPIVEFKGASMPTTVGSPKPAVVVEPQQPTPVVESISDIIKPAPVARKAK